MKWVVNLVYGPHIVYIISFVIEKYYVLLYAIVRID